MDYDFAHPPVSEITADLKGVAILLWGANGTGKTPIACGFEKPYYLGFESGLTGIRGIPNQVIGSWKKFIEFVKWATNPATTAQAHEVAQTIILDTVDVMGDYCSDFVCSRLGVSSIGEVRLNAEGKKDGSINAYKELGLEFKRRTRALRTAGFTLVYIAHDGGYRDDVDPVTHQKYTKMYPSGDKRVIEPICDDVDVIAYLQAAPLDPNGHPVYSTAFFAPNPLFHARSRYAEIVPYVQMATAKNIAEAIITAKQKELERTGSSAVTYEEQVKPFIPDQALTLDEMKSEIGRIARALYDADEDHHRKSEYDAIVEQDWGKGNKVSDAKDENYEVLSLILSDLKGLEIA